MFLRFTKTAKLDKTKKYVKIVYLNGVAIMEDGDEIVGYAELDLGHTYKVYSKDMKYIDRIKRFIGSAERWNNINIPKRRKYVVKITNDLKTPIITFKKPINNVK